MLTETQAELEVTQFLARRPSPEDIIAFHPSSAVAARLYELIDLERTGHLGEQERRELESYLYLEHLMRLMKADAHRQLGQQAS
ncbi:MAG TPA: hypothetical protein VFU69_16635 [Ktedonobacterales bacterium]|nr:hypothetical protein [Ktedonobacterales bacterium]